MIIETPRAAVRSPVAPLFDEPRISSVQISQLLAGHPVELLEERDGWCCVRGVDHYEGWMHRGYLHADGVAGSHTRLSLGCVVTRAGVRRALPLGAYLAPEDDLVDGETIDVADQAHHFPREASAITRTARRYFEGTSYQWGGVTPWGADCSGLVQTVFRLHGITLPRDAWQQAGIPGWSDVPAKLAELEAGDLLFFSDREDGRITHVGIAADARRMVHLALGRGGYAVERLDADDGYVTALRTRFRGARRMPPAVR